MLSSCRLSSQLDRAAAPPYGEYQGAYLHPRAQIKTYVRVVFSKSTWLKGTIEKHTLAAVKEAQADFIVKSGQATGVHMSPFQVLSLDSVLCSCCGLRARVEAGVRVVRCH